MVGTEIITRKENASRLVMTTTRRTEMEEIGIGLVIVTNVKANEIVMVEIMMKNTPGKEIIADHVIGTMTKTEIGIEDMREIATGTTTTRIVRDTVETGVDRGVMQMTVAEMKLYTFSLSFMLKKLIMLIHKFGSFDINFVVCFTVTLKSLRVGLANEVHF